MRRRTIKALAPTFAIVFAPLAFFVFTSFLIYQPSVNRVIANLSPEERHLSPEVADVFTKLDGKAMPLLVSEGPHALQASSRQLLWHVEGPVC
jgi:hypothetical protein